MFTTINGFTKAKMIEMVSSKMLDHQSYDHSKKLCQYQAPDGNRCAVGVFIPDGHVGLNNDGEVYELLGVHPDLKQHMPLNMEGLYQMQQVHDSCARTGDPRGELVAWITDHVEDAPAA